MQVQTCQKLKLQNKNKNQNKAKKPYNFYRDPNRGALSKNKSRRPQKINCENSNQSNLELFR